MEIYLLRHGIAEDGKPGSRDSDRALTGEGKRRLREVLDVARRAEVAPKLILSSPYLRAVETARIAAEVLGVKSPIVEDASFTPMADVRSAWDGIRHFKDTDSLLVATHEPLTGLLIGHLCGAPGLTVDVKKGSITRIDTGSFGAQPRGVLRWILTPKLAAALSG